MHSDTVVGIVLVEFLSPVKGDIVFGLSVCPSVRPSVRLSGTLFSHFVRVTPPTVKITNSNFFRASQVKEFWV